MNVAEARSKREHSDQLDRVHPNPFSYDAQRAPGRYYFIDQKYVENPYSQYQMAVVDPTVLNRQWFAVLRDSALEIRKVAKDLHQYYLDFSSIMSVVEENNKKVEEALLLNISSVDITSDLMHSFASALRLDLRQDVAAYIDAAVFLENLYRQNKQRAASDSIVTLIRTIFEWTSKKNYDAINLVMVNARLSDLAPELIVGILRAAGHVRDKTPAWSDFLESAYNELTSRGYDAEEALRGLREPQPQRAEKST